MCQTCGCGDPQIVPVDVHERILAGNDRTARHNREHFDEHGVLAINLMGSPGSGKTAVLEATARVVGGTLASAPSAAISPLITTRAPARAPASPSIAITTGSACHLDAEMVHHALHDFDLERARPALHRERRQPGLPRGLRPRPGGNVVALSVTEGEDKPLKYPVMFRTRGPGAADQDRLAAAPARGRRQRHPRRPGTGDARTHAPATLRPLR